MMRSLTQPSVRRSPRRRLSLCRIVYICSSLFVPGQASAQAEALVLDQSTLISGDEISIAAGIGLAEVAQTFTVGTSGILSSLQLWIRTYEDVDDADLIIEVHPMISGTPPENLARPLAAVVFHSSAVPVSATSNELTGVDLRRFKIAVHEGDELAVVLRTREEPEHGLGFSWDGTFHDYPGGRGFFRLRGDAEWQTDDDAVGRHADLGMKTFVELCRFGAKLHAQVTPVAEPGHITPELFANAVESVTVEVSAGNIGTTRIYGAFVSDLETQGGIQAWSIFAAPLGDVVITDVTTDGTAAAPSPEGIFTIGFNRTELILNRSMTCVDSAAVSAIVLSLTEAVSLPPRGTATVLSLGLEARSPQGSENVLGRIVWPVDCCRWQCSRRKCGQPCKAHVTVEDTTKDLCESRGVDISFVKSSRIEFLRGDSNGDGRVDISDAVRTFMFLFLGAPPPLCLDAADAYDDGEVNMTDGILILHDFFRQGTGISEPGPFTCGGDPTPDQLGCASYTPCE